MPAITSNHTPISAETFQDADFVNEHYREIETKALDHFRDEFRKNESSLDKVSTVVLTAFLRKSGGLYQDWRILKKNLTDKYEELQRSRNLEYELAYRSLVANKNHKKPTALIEDIFQSAVDGVLNTVYAWFDVDKKSQSRASQQSTNTRDSSAKDDELKRLYREMIQKKLKERDRSFSLFRDLLEGSALNWNQKYRKKFHQSLESTVKRLGSSKASKAEILSNKKAAKKAVLGFQEEDRIRKYSIFMIDYFFDQLLKNEPVVENKIVVPERLESQKSEEKSQNRKNDKSPALIPNSTGEKSEVQKVVDRILVESDRENERLSSSNKTCPITDLPQHLIKECYSDYLIVDLSTKEKRLELHRIRLGKENQNTRAEAVEFFNDCANKDPFAITLAESVLKRHSITQEEEDRLNEMIRKQKACK
ncbi:hypothetical protein [Leptospira santarosai]|uniref:Uncharacterized protein n=1 Tax=Leptospira santarosai TaxID=28183 RepID=A0AB73M9I7_9LEPT|nr:hypothetical protein [Leptospira santarosai]AVV50001.1 Uncharacterized protein XB17_01407 [Leptospira santarosai]EMO70649.1 hypothetical protein LEP1GSC130_3340 [Leptospira santarosai str. 200403458]EMO97019.1 hypothetical protein LEP1GSC120_0249 [Leptospira santarosai str. 200702252]MDI7173589.1 hypothetical protein [Leptospira santarosai]MDI7194741.1 hypothetical protein [Leptospira santarosai]